MDREQLVEAMAIGMLEAVRGIGWWGEISEDERKELREYARAALAVAEPAVREDVANELFNDGHFIAAGLVRRTGGTP